MKQLCMECKKEFIKEELHWVKDNRMIPYKKVCDECYSKVNQEISENNYDEYLTNYEIYGDVPDDFEPDHEWW